MSNKDEIKVDSFVFYDKPYNAINRVTHGLEYYYKGYSLVKYNNKLYLANILREEIETDEGSGYNLSGMGKHDYVGDITEELNIPWIDEARTKIDYTFIDGLKKINKNGELSSDVGAELKEKIKEFKSISVSTDDENYMQQEDENISVNPILEQNIKNRLNIDISYSTVTISKDNIPYGRINATLELKYNKLILHMNEKEYVLDELQETKKENNLNNTVISEEKKQELLEILTKQQEKIVEQEAELSELEDKRRRLDE